MSNRLKRWCSYTSLLPWALPVFYSTGLEGLALNVSDICSDAKLGTLILDTHLKLIVSICCD